MSYLSVKQCYIPVCYINGKYICEKIRILFAVNKFYLYICTNKTKAPIVRRGRKAFTTKKKSIMYIGLYIIISLILVVLRR